MNTETFKHLKGEYTNFLFTDKGKNMLHEAVRLKTQWGYNKNKITQKSKSVKKHLLPQEFQDRMSLIKVTPIGLNNCCHDNCIFFEKHGFNSRTGYNVFACECGKNIAFEEHSVNEKDGVLYDFTKDFDDENEKWFLELRTRSSYKQLKSVFGYVNKNIDLGCKCNIKWDSGAKKITADKFMDEIKMKEQIVILG